MIQGQPTSFPRTTGMSLAMAFFAQSMIPSKTTLPLNCSTSVALVMERSNSAYGRAGDSVVHFHYTIRLPANLQRTEVIENMEENEKMILN